MPAVKFVQQPPNFVDELVELVHVAEQRGRMSTPRNLNRKKLLQYFFFFGGGRQIHSAADRDDMIVTNKFRIVKPKRSEIFNP